MNKWYYDGIYKVYFNTRVHFLACSPLYTVTRISLMMLGVAENMYFPHSGCYDTECKYVLEAS